MLIPAELSVLVAVQLHRSHRHILIVHISFVLLLLTTPVPRRVTFIKPQGNTTENLSRTAKKMEVIEEQDDREGERKRVEKISAANDLYAIEINPKIIYFCHKLVKDFWFCHCWLVACV